MAEAKPNTTPNPLSLEQYLHDTYRPENTQPESQIGQLKLGHARWGLGPSQMSLLLQLAQAFRLLPFEKKGTLGDKQQGTVLPNSAMPALAALVHEGFNRLAYSKTPRRTTLEELYPTAVTVISDIRTTLAQHPELQTRYPQIGEMLLNPSHPSNPNNVVTLVRVPFIPSAYFESLAPKPTSAKHQQQY